MLDTVTAVRRSETVRRLARVAVLRLLLVAAVTLTGMLFMHVIEPHDTPALMADVPLADMDRGAHHSALSTARHGGSDDEPPSGTTHVGGAEACLAILMAAVGLWLIAARQTPTVGHRSSAAASSHPSQPRPPWPPGPGRRAFCVEMR
jgi:hypothetical protein